jgi:hypothetical protein
LEGNSIHPWEGVGNIVDSRLFQFAKEAIGTESNVLAHEGCIHTHEVERKRVANEVTSCLLTLIANFVDSESLKYTKCHKNARNVDSNESTLPYHLKSAHAVFSKF